MTLFRNGPKNGYYFCLINMELHYGSIYRIYYRKAKGPLL